MDYKKDITLNERDSIYDLLLSEKELVKKYAFALTEGCSKGFRNSIKNLFLDSSLDQNALFLLLTECGYYKVTSAENGEKLEIKGKIKQVLEGLQ